MLLSLTMSRAEEKALLQAAQARFPALAAIRSFETQDGQVSAKVELPVGVVEVRLALQIETPPG